MTTACTPAPRLSMRWARRAPPRHQAREIAPPLFCGDYNPDNPDEENSPRMTWSMVPLKESTASASGPFCTHTYP